MITGIILPLITPFKSNGEVDLPVYRALVDDALRAGAHGIFLLGSQGQGPTMTPEERTDTAEKMIAYVNGRVPVIVHVGTTDALSTGRLAKAAEAAGADGIAIIPPYYYSDHTKEEVDIHFLQVAEATSLPIVAYNNAKYAGINITPEWLAGLAAKIPSLRGVKLSYASSEAMLQYVAKLPDRVHVFSGSTINLLPTVPFGVRGAINPLAVLFPDLAVSIWNEIANQNWAAAFRLQDAVNRLSLGIAEAVRKYGREVYKEGLRLRGIPVEKFPRWASKEMPEAGVEELRNLLGVG